MVTFSEANCGNTLKWVRSYYNQLESFIKKKPTAGVGFLISIRFFGYKSWQRKLSDFNEWRWWVTPLLPEPVTVVRSTL